MLKLKDSDPNFSNKISFRALRSIKSSLNFGGEKTGQKVESQKQDEDIYQYLQRSKARISLIADARPRQLKQLYIYIYLS